MNENAPIVQLSKSLALAWAADNIQVNALLPGWFETELTDGARAQVPRLYERVLARIPTVWAGQRTLPGLLFGWQAMPVATSPAPPSRLTAAFPRVCFERRSVNRSRRQVVRAEELQRSLVARPSH